MGKFDGQNRFARNSRTQRKRGQNEPTKNEGSNKKKWEQMKGILKVYVTADASTTKNTYRSLVEKSHMTERQRERLYE